ncbi:MAG: hypothetical protein ABIG56_06115 [Candidatus Omnitrophota bacterium]
MRLKLSLKNSAKTVLLFNLLFSFILAGCQQDPIEPTYKEENILSTVKKICKEEFGLDVVTKRSTNTLWIYAPMDKLLDKDYGIVEGKVFDEEISHELNNILSSIGRVLLSSENNLEFYVMVASDIKAGLDYTIAGNVLDTQKSYAGVIPWTEVNRRYVIGFAENPEAIDDATGEHIQAFDIRFEDFLVALISQRITAKFQDENWKEYFEVEKSNGYFADNTLFFEYSIKQIKPLDEEIDIKQEILKIIFYCVDTYEFRGFSEVRLIDLLKQDTVVLNQAAILAQPKH